MTALLMALAICGALLFGFGVGWTLRQRRDRALIAKGADLVAQLISVNTALEAQNAALDKLLVDTLCRWAGGSRRGGQ